MWEMPDISLLFEKISKIWEGGVRVSVLIFSGVVLVASVPAFFGSQALAKYLAQNGPVGQIVHRESILTQKRNQEAQFEVSDYHRIELHNGEQVYVLQLDNRQNPQTGYDPLVYQVQIVGPDFLPNSKSEVLYETIEETYILPGKMNYLVINAGKVNGYKPIFNMLPESQPRSFNPYASDWVNVSEENNTQDDIEDRIEISSTTVRNPRDNKTLQLSAKVRNQSLFRLREIDLYYEVIDATDAVVGAGYRQITDLKPQEQRSLEIKYPQPKYRRPQNFQIIPRVNFLEENNIQIER
jgi:hypothetical protein